MHVGGNGNGRNVEPECADGEESENGFGEHDDGECRKREQMTTAPDLRLEKGTGESCTAAEETRERTSKLLYLLGTVECRYGSNALSSFSLSLAHNLICPIGGRVYPRCRESDGFSGFPRSQGRTMGRTVLDLTGC